MDVWDGDDGEPIIYHGHTLTSKISLEDVLKDGVKAYAFEVSPYPVILSIENHLSLDQQRVMVRLMEDILGGEEGEEVEEEVEGEREGRERGEEGREGKREE